MARRQHYLFAYKKLPQLFHEDPQRFFAHLSNDSESTTILRLWEETATEFDLDRKDIVAPTGLQISFREEKDYGLMIISLPPPKKPPEAYWIGIWASYSAHHKGNSFRYFILELDQFSKRMENNVSIQHPITHFCELTKDGNHYNYGQVSEASIEQFVEKIEDCIKVANSEDSELCSESKVRVRFEPESSNVSKSAHSSSTQKITNSTPTSSLLNLTAGTEVKNSQTRYHLSNPSDFFMKEIVRVFGNSDQSPEQNSTMTSFKGTFKPPIISLQTTPIKVAGLGQCEPLLDGLKVRGFKQTPRFSSTQLAILFLVLYFSGKLIGGMLSLLFTVPAAWLLFSALRGQGEDHKEEMVELLIPWENVSTARFDRISGTVMIHVKDFRYQKERYKGALFFQPTVEPDLLLNALKSHNVQCKR